MMYSIYDFIDEDKHSEIFEIFKKYTSLEEEIEFLILKTIVVLSYKDQIPILVRDILLHLEEQVKDKYTHLDYLIAINKLFVKGFIVSKNDVKDLSLYGYYFIDISLSDYFFRFMSAEGFPKIEIKPYNSNEDFFKDAFLFVDYCQKAYIEKLNVDVKFLPTYVSFVYYLKDIIEKKLEKTKNIPIINFFNKYQLTDIERFVIIVLLKEDLFHNEQHILRDYNSLIKVLRLYAKDDFEIYNLLLNVDKSKLIKKDLIAFYGEHISGVSTFSFYLTYKSLKKLKIIKNKSKKLKLKKLLKQQDMFELIKKDVVIDDVVLPEDIKKDLNNLLAQLNPLVSNRLKEWNLKKKNIIDSKIIFYGDAGVGKTITAVALANSLNKKILSLDCSKILSKWHGESEQNVRKVFDDFKKIQKQSKEDLILLLNEADQFFGQRIEVGVSGTDRVHNQIQNIFLEQIENFEGIIIATTNLLENIDKAFSRRFNYKIKFPKPTKELRKKLWRKLLPKNLPFSDNFDLDKLSSFDLTGAQIELVIKNTAFKVATEKNPIFTTEKFVEEIEKELKNMFDSKNLVGFL